MWKCPNCKGENGYLRTIALTTVCILSDGESAEAEGDLEWESDARAWCSCNWVGQIGDCVVDDEDEDEYQPDGPQSYVEKRYCPHCGIDTAHIIHDSNHERDSSNDWRRCRKCGAQWSGLTGKYGEPERKITMSSVEPMIDLNTLADQIKQCDDFGKAMGVLHNHIGSEAFRHFEKLVIRAKMAEIDADLKARGLPPRKGIEELLTDDPAPQGRPLIDVLFKDE